MNHPMRIVVSALALSMAAACGGTTAAPSATVTPTATPAPTVAASTQTASPAAPSASPAPAYAGVGSATAKVTETKYVAKATPVHIGFIGDDASLKPDTYTETLNVVTLQAGGRTVSHKHGGLETIFVIEGSVDVNMGAAGRAMLTVGQTVRIPANTPLQANNAGSGVAKFLAFFVTADGQPVQTNLDTLP